MNVYKLQCKFNFKLKNKIMHQFSLLFSRNINMLPEMKGVHPSHNNGSNFKVNPPVNTTHTAYKTDPELNNFSREL
jgi:hypothetical protein